MCAGGLRYQRGEKARPRESAPGDFCLEIAMRIHDARTCNPVCASGIMAVAVILFFYPCAEAIDLEVIKTIESEGNRLAFNSRSKCYGLYQISEICLLDFNQINKTSYVPAELFDPHINRMIAGWYFKRIQRMLAYYKIPVSATTLIASYNWGIGNVVKWQRNEGKFNNLPKVTKRYIARYRKLVGAKAR
jgi:hypothetical protein